VTSGLFLVLALNGWPVAAFVTAYVLFVPYNILAAMGVWRSAGRYRGERHRADLARLVTVAGMVFLSLT